MAGPITKGEDGNGRVIIVGVLGGVPNSDSCGIDENDYISDYTDVRDPLVYNWLKENVNEVATPGSIIFQFLSLIHI